MSELRATFVIDYQNVHLTGLGLFAPGQPPHEHLVHPLRYANQIVTYRNQLQKKGYAHAIVNRVLVYRGLPSSDIDPYGNRRNLAQKAEWERDPRVTVVHRPLRYDYQRDESGRKISDQRGSWLTKGKPREKGIVVLCALAVVREARAAELVIVCSQDTDLVPALNEALQLQCAKIETASWFDAKVPRQSHEIRPEKGRRRIWNTRLDANAFSACRDPKDYM